MAKNKKVFNEELSEKAKRLKGEVRHQVKLDAFVANKAAIFEDKYKAEKKGKVKHRKDIFK